MTKLQQEIYDRVCNAWAQPFNREYVAKAAAEVCLKCIEKAFIAGSGFPPPREFYESWAKENGIIPSNTKKIECTVISNGDIELI